MAFDVRDGPWYCWDIYEYELDESDFQSAVNKPVLGGPFVDKDKGKGRGTG